MEEYHRGLRVSRDEAGLARPPHRTCRAHPVAPEMVGEGGVVLCVETGIE